MRLSGEYYNAPEASWKLFLEMDTAFEKVKSVILVTMSRELRMVATKYIIYLIVELNRTPFYDFGSKGFKMKTKKDNHNLKIASPCLVPNEWPTRY